MGDLVMTAPALRALKESFDTRITVLTSSMATGIAKMIPEIDEVITYDLPWVKAAKTVPAESLTEVVNEIRSRNFDAAVVFTVYSQNPLPTVMLAYLAGIPRRLSYCRENPYEMLTHWVPDTEPYSEIKHQVRRDLDLVARVGAVAKDERLSLNTDERLWLNLQQKLEAKGINMAKRWLIMHPGVSERKREYPARDWITTGRALAAESQILLTGGPSERSLTDTLEDGIGAGAFSLAGDLSLGEFVLLIKKAPLVVSVNTGTVHLAAACSTPVIVLYALTNPQHYPWKAAGRVFTFDVPQGLKSRNEVISYVNTRYFSEQRPLVKPAEIVSAAKEILAGQMEMIPELELL